MYKLVKYRDAGMNTYTYFWVDMRGQVESPYFDSEEDAHKWMRDLEYQWENFQLNKDMS